MFFFHHFTKAKFYGIMLKEVTSMKNKNRYKFTFGEKVLTLTTDKDNLFMEEVERVALEKYQAIKRRGSLKLIMKRSPS